MAPGAEIYCCSGGGNTGCGCLCRGSTMLFSSPEWPSFPESSAASPESYEKAMYHVYSDLLQVQPGWLQRWVDPSERASKILIQTETEPGLGEGVEGRLVPDEPFMKAVAEATDDYINRNASVLNLQKKFALPIPYDLITQKEEFQACETFHQRYPGYDRWVQLSAVGFNPEQTVAVVRIVQWRAAASWKTDCNVGWDAWGATGGFRMLQKKHGKWKLLRNHVFFDWAIN